MDGHVFALHQYGRNVTFLTFYHKIIIFFSYFHMLFNKLIERSVQKAHWNVIRTMKQSHNSSPPFLWQYVDNPSTWSSKVNVWSTL